LQIEIELPPKKGFCRLVDVSYVATYNYTMAKGGAMGQSVTVENRQ
jgi:hypothetical protein